MVQLVSDKKEFLVRFQYGCEKYITFNQTTIVIVEKSPVNEESKMPTIYVTPDENIHLEKGYYNGVYVILYYFK